jgi:NADPH:quinone reductase-like Zn-dependent oxidoreductase
MDLRAAIWNRLGADLKPPALERIVSRTVRLEDVIPACATLMNRTALGRVLVDCR